MSKEKRNPEYMDSIESPIGWWIIKANEIGITDLGYSAQKPDIQILVSEKTALAREQLQAYFRRELVSFDLPLSLEGYTSFYRSVWDELTKIPFGRTTSYSDLSIKMGNPKAVRAVGTANGRNPIPIIIPCHRVLGKNKSLTGYAHGLAVKRWLLEHEGAIAHEPTLF